MSAVLNIAPETREIRCFHVCCGSGGGAKGVLLAKSSIGTMSAHFRNIGGIDVKPTAIKDFSHVAGVAGTVIDLFTRQQYIDFHGREPPAGWREVTAADIRQAAHGERPHIVLISSPCKGLSALLSEARSTSPKYQALNQLLPRAVSLVLEAWADDPPEFILCENVPRVLTRGRPMLDDIKGRVSAKGYASAETTHNCGEIGNLSQSRERFLLVCRHEEKVPPFLYEPYKHPLRSIGSLFDKLPLAGDTSKVGALHRVPSLQFLTWLRLAFVEPGKDWRSLKRLAVTDGALRDYVLVPERPYFSGAYGVRTMDEPCGTVAGESLPTNGAFSVADPRIDGHPSSVQHGVRAWTEIGPTVTGQMWPGQGPCSVADPRLDAVKHNNCFRVVRWDEVGRSVTGGTGPSAGGVAVADPRTGYGDSSHQNKLHVGAWAAPSKTVTGSDRVGSGALSVADPRVGLHRAPGAAFDGSGHYGVLRYTDTANTVTAAMGHDNGYGSVADPRLPAATDNLVCVIRSEWNTWNRPITTYEMAALQGYVEPGEHLEMAATSDAGKREAIGDMIPTPTAAAIFSIMGQTLLLAWAGETFVLGPTPIWVRDLRIALALPGRHSETLQ